MSNTKWALDASHSEVSFKVKHLMITNVSGHFKKFDATVETEGDDMTTAKVNFSADVDSISTNNEQRDGHLKTGDFFDAANHPQIIFTSETLQKVDDETYNVNGTLTMRGVSHPITMSVEHGPIITDPWGYTRTGFTLHGKVSRKAFGVSFGLLTETGGITVSDEVNISASVEFIKMPETATA